MVELDATRPRRASVWTAVFASSAAAWLFLQLGYGFESNDQVQYLLLPYRELIPGFLPGDWFTWQTSHYHVTFSWLVRGLHAASGGDNLRFAVLAAHLGSLALLGYGFLRLSRSLGGGAFEAAAALLIFGCARETGLAGSILNHGCLLPSDLAFAPFLLACAALLERREREAGLWLGLSGFLHANFAVLGPAVLFPIALLRAVRSGAWLPFARMLGLYGLIAAPTLVLLAGSFLAQDHAPEAIGITLFVRSPHHYDLGSMPARDFYWGGLLVLLSVPAWLGPYVAPRRAERTQLALALSVYIGLGFLGAWLHILPLTRLFTFRLSIPLFALLLLSTASVAHAVVARRDLAGTLWLCAALAVLAMFVREDVLTLMPWRTPPQDLDPLARPQLGWLFGAVLAPLALATLALVALRVRRTLAVGLLVALPLLASLWVSQIPLGHVWTGLRFRAAHGFHWFDRRIEMDPPDRDLYRQARESTPNDARFMIPPGLFEFRLRARRTIFVDWKCTPMKGDEALEWKRRMLAAMGARDFPGRGYELPARADGLYYARPVVDLLALARLEGMTHLIVRKSQLRRNMQGAQLLFTSGSLAVLALSTPPAGVSGS